MDAMEHLLFVLELRISADEDREAIRKAVIEISECWNAQRDKSLDDPTSPLAQLSTRWSRRHRGLPLRTRPR